MLRWFRGLFGPDIEFHSGARSAVVLLRPGGSASIRDDGGPRYSMGAAVNAKSDTVPVWRTRAGRKLYRSLVAALRETGFPSDIPTSLLADERPSYVTIRDGRHQVVHLPQVFLDRYPRLAAVCDEVDDLCYRVRQQPPSEHMPNPELGAWR